MAELKHMLITRSAPQAERLRRQLGSVDVSRNLKEASPEWLVTHPGDSLMGRRVKNIVVSGELYAELESPDESTQEQAPHRWWRESVLCRLVPGGQLIVL